MINCEGYLVLNGSIHVKEVKRSPLQQCLQRRILFLSLRCQNFVFLKLHLSSQACKNRIFYCSMVPKMPARGDGKRLSVGFPIVHHKMFARVINACENVDHYGEKSCLCRSVIRLI
jgi:hypothetical protein